MELIMTNLVELSITILIIVINIAFGYLITILKKHKVIQELKSHEEIVKIAVKAVQEGYSTMKGEEKFEVAKGWILDTLNNKKIKVSEKQVDYLIDSVVKDMKKQFGDEWKKG